ncbi:hypothetical protein QOT17_019035 [Balamuthia mandrillaris]
MNECPLGWKGWDSDTPVGCLCVIGDPQVLDLQVATVAELLDQQSSFEAILVRGSNTRTVKLTRDVLNGTINRQQANCAVFLTTMSDGGRKPMKTRFYLNLRHRQTWKIKSLQREKELPEEEKEEEEEEEEREELSSSGKNRVFLHSWKPDWSMAA